MSNITFQYGGYFDKFRQIDIWDFLFVIYLLMIFVTGLNFPFDPVAEAEIGRDYLVASHVVDYGDFPLQGPNNSLVKFLPHSPFYYYFLASLLSVNNDVLFLKTANIYLQLVSIIAIYLLAKAMFGSKTALLASAFLMLNNRTLYSFAYHVHPGFVNPFLSLSYLLLFIGYLKKELIFVLISIFLFVSSAALHMGPVIVLPAYALAGLFVLRGQNKDFRDYFLCFFFGITLFMLYWFPFFVDIAREGGLDPVPDRKHIVIGAFSDLASNFLGGLKIFLAASFQRAMDHRFLLYLLSFMAAVGSVAAIFRKSVRENRIYAAVILVTLLQSLALLSLAKPTIYTYHFIPIYGLFAILFGYLLVLGTDFLFVKKPLADIVVAVIVIFFIGYSALDPNIVTAFDLKKFSLSSQYLVSLKTALISSIRPIRSARLKSRGSEDAYNSVINSMADEAVRLKQKGNYDNFNFFQLLFYRPHPSLDTHLGKMHLVVDAVFWSPLEKRFNTKFVRTTGSADAFYAYVYYSYWPVNSDDYIFIICYQNDLVSEKDCLNAFFKEHPGHSYSKEVLRSETLNVYLAEQKKSDIVR